MRLLDRNLYDKLSFFTHITTHDMVAPAYGQRKYETYLREEEDLAWVKSGQRYRYSQK